MMSLLDQLRDTALALARKSQQWHAWIHAHKVIIRVIACTLAFLILGVLIQQVFENWGQLKECCQDPNIGRLLGALFLICTAVGLLAWNWLLILWLLGGNLSFQEGLKIYFLTNLGRYLPGSIWHFAGRTVWLVERNISKRAAMSSLALEQGATLGASLVIGVLSIIGLMPPNRKSIFLFFGLLVILLITYKIIFRWAINNFGLGQNPTGISAQSKQRRIDLLPLMYLSFWIIYGLGIYTLAQAIYSFPFSILQMFQTVGIVALAWAVGYLSLAVPGGVGVREGMLVLLLSNFLPVPVASIIALFSRGIQIAAEVLWVTVAVSASHIVARLHQQTV